MAVRDIRDLPFGRETIFNLPDRPKFIVERTRTDCSVCDKRGEEPEVAEWSIVHNGQNIDVCNAHMQEFLDSVNDKIEKGAGVKDWFSK